MTQIDCDNLVDIPVLPNLTHITISFDYTPAPAYSLNYDFIEKFNSKFPSLTTFIISLPNHCMDAMNIISYSSLKRHQHLVIEPSFDTEDLVAINSSIVTQFINNVPPDRYVHINSGICHDLYDIVVTSNPESPYKKIV